MPLITFSARLQRFTADFRDLTSWVTEMKALINADELANDVAGAEALLDRHQEHKVVINTPGQSFAVSLRPLFNAWDAPIRILGANGR